MALYRSNLTQGYMVYGSVPSNIVTWEEPIDPSSNRTRKFKRSTWKSGKGTSGKPDLPVEKLEKKQGYRGTRKETKKSGWKLGGKPGKLGDEAGETSISSRNNQEENQEARVKNPSNRKGNRRGPRSFREKSGGHEEKQKKNQTLIHVPNLTPTPASVRSDPTTILVIPTSPESQNNPSTPSNQKFQEELGGEKAGAGYLAPAPRSRPEPAQNEFHPDVNKINQ